MTRLLFTLAFGILLGLAGGYFLFGSSSKDQELKRAQEKISFLEDQLVVTEGRKPSLLSNLKSKILSKGSGEPKESGQFVKSKTTIHVDGDVSPEKMSKIREMLQKQLDDKRNREIDFKFNTLAKQLNFSEEQEDRVRELLKRRYPRKKSPLSLGQAERTSDFPIEESEPLNANQFSEALAELLDEDQSQLYDEFQEQERANAIEAKVNTELARLQTSLNLDGEQKDAVFAALTTFESEHYREDSPSLLSGDVDFRALESMREAKSKVLQPILTEDQFQLYEKLPFAGSGAAEVFSESLGGQIKTFKILKN